MKRCWVICLLSLLVLSACKKKAPSTDTVTEKAAEKVTENQVGVVFYPKSTEWGTGSTAGQESGAAASARQTDDPPEKVIAFYKEQIKEAKVTADKLGDLIHTNITGKTKDGAEVEVLVMKTPQQKTQIFISVRRQK